MVQLVAGRLRQQRRTIEQLTRQLREQREAAAGAGRRKPPAQGGVRVLSYIMASQDLMTFYLILD